MDTLKDNFKELKKIKWSEAIATFYVVKKTIKYRKAKYQTFLVETDKVLQKKIISSACKKIESSNNALEYDFNTIDLDDNVLEIPTKETDFQGILDAITGNEQLETITDYTSLMGSYMYVARLDKGRNTLYSARKIFDGWSAKKIFTGMQLIWKDSMLIDIDQKDMFRIDKKIDFFAFNGSIFIADKKCFETALNFRDGMIKNRDEIVKEFKSLQLFVNADEISKLVGDNIPRLRKLSQVTKAGYYKNKDFLSKLKKINYHEGWGLEYSDTGELKVTKDNIDTILTVLNNSRLTSQINNETFDASVKQKV